MNRAPVPPPYKLVLIYTPCKVANDMIAILQKLPVLVTLHKPGFFHDFCTTQAAETPSINQNRKSPSTPIGFQPVTWFHRYTCLGSWASRISRTHFRQAAFLLQRFQFCKDVFFFSEKKNTDSRKKLRLQLVTVSLLACLLLEKKKHPKKRETYGIIWGFCKYGATQLLPADPKGCHWVGDMFNALVASM